MATTKPDVFLILLRYAEVSDHKLNAVHAAKATGIGKSTAFSKIANAKKVLADSSAQIPCGLEAFQALLSYAELAGHKLNAKHAADAAKIGKSTAFSKIAEAKEASARANKSSEASPTPTAVSALRNRKRKNDAASKAVVTAGETVLSTAKRMKRANDTDLKDEVKEEGGEKNIQMEEHVAAEEAEPRVAIIDELVAAGDA